MGGSARVDGGDATTVETNPAYPALLGRTRDELLGRRACAIARTGRLERIAAVRLEGPHA